MRNKIVREIRKSKQDYFDKPDGQLSSDNHDPKLFVKSSKQVGLRVLNLDKSSSVPPRGGGGGGVLSIFLHT